ncbi:hypothetical protein EJ07DRAFT_176392 [Lizonia empirigonia]|nr:hypothetical protein EJ07DRAFT_176392 [Lizonia empirigonia]
MHLFATQLHPAHHDSLSLRATQYRKKRRGTHHDDRDDDQHSFTSASDVDPQSRAAPSNAHAHPSFAPSELAQLHVAGLLPEEDYRVPPSPFPHAPASPPKPYLGAASIQKELAGPPSRLFTLNSTASKRDHVSSHAEASNLRRKHLNVLSTVLHTCLLQADYHRAGRAWGMILRSQATHGHPVDLRNHGRWAMGADILLRRKPRRVPSNDQSDAVADTHIDSDIDIFSEAGFELAREYYERLIVQYPTRKQAPNAVDQRSFYPAMFSLWVQEVTEKSKRTRRKNEEEARRSRSRSMSIDSGHGKPTDDARSREEAIQAEELAQATEIAERLDDLVKSPPFDKQASLLQLRGAIALWISDLIVGNTPATATDEWDVYPISNDIPVAEQITRFNNCQRELHTAQNYLARVEDNGGPRQYLTLKKIEGRLRELQQQIAILQTGGDDDANTSMEDVW